MRLVLLYQSAYRAKPRVLLFAPIGVLLQLISMVIQYILVFLHPFKVTHFPLNDANKTELRNK